MRDYARVSGFTLIIIGTVGLLVNEFVVEWGRIATLIFASLNLLGLGTLVIKVRRRGPR